MEKVDCRLERIRFTVAGSPVEIAVRVWEPAHATASVVCVHGFSGSSSDFWPLADRLLMKGITTIAPDMLGRGDSSYLPDTALYTVRHFLLGLAVTNRFQLPVNGFLGSSWGGLMALAYAAADRWRAACLVLNDCPVRMSSDTETFQRALRDEAVLRFPKKEDAARYLTDSRSLHFLQEPMRSRVLNGRLRKENGTWRLNCDPALAETLRPDSVFSTERLLRHARRPVLLNYGLESPYAQEPLHDEIVKSNDRISIFAYNGCTASSFVDEVIRNRRDHRLPFAAPVRPGRLKTWNSICAASPRDVASARRSMSAPRCKRDQIKHI